MVMINDGSGEGNGNAKVNSNNKLEVKAETSPHDRHLANDGKVWSLYFTATPTGTNDYIFYIENTGTAELHITDIRIMCASADTFLYEKVSGTESGGTAITPSNRNVGSSKIPTATIESGNNITGLTQEDVIFFERCATANTRYKLNTTSNIHIPQGGKFAIKAVTGTALTTCVVSLTEDELDG